MVLLQQLVHGEDVNISQGLRGSYLKASLVEENLQTDLNDLETRHTTAQRKLIKKKIRVHEQSAELEDQRIWWLKQKGGKRFSIILDHFPNVGL
jgi:carbonic anhydrase